VQDVFQIERARNGLNIVQKLSAPVDQRKGGSHVSPSNSWLDSVDMLLSPLPHSLHIDPLYFHRLLNLISFLSILSIRCFRWPRRLSPHVPSRSIHVQLEYKMQEHISRDHGPASNIKRFRKKLVAHSSRINRLTYICLGH
jgi:hypothetical protein